MALCTPRFRLPTTRLPRRRRVEGWSVMAGRTEKLELTTKGLRQSSIRDAEETSYFCTNHAHVVAIQPGSGAATSGGTIAEAARSNAALTSPPIRMARPVRYSQKMRIATPANAPYVAPYEPKLEV